MLQDVITKMDPTVSSFLKLLKLFCDSSFTILSHCRNVVEICYTSFVVAPIIASLLLASSYPCYFNVVIINNWLIEVK